MGDKLINTLASFHDDHFAQCTTIFNKIKNNSAATSSGAMESFEVGMTAKWFVLCLHSLFVDLMNVQKISLVQQVLCLVYNISNRFIIVLHYNATQFAFVPFYICNLNELRNL